MSGARKSGVEMSTKAPLLGGHAAAPAESSHGDGEIHGKPKFSDQQASEDKAMVEQVRQRPCSIDGGRLGGVRGSGTSMAAAEPKNASADGLRNSAPARTRARRPRLTTTSACPVHQRAEWLLCPNSAGQRWRRDL